jgi:hypothetical protein
MQKKNPQEKNAHKRCVIYLIIYACVGKSGLVFPILLYIIYEMVGRLFVVAVFSSEMSHNLPLAFFFFHNKKNLQSKKYSLHIASYNIATPTKGKSANVTLPTETL